jgi:hypothetical protein
LAAHLFLALQRASSLAPPQQRLQLLSAAAAKAGKLGAAIQSILADLKPEALISPTTTVNGQGFFAAIG